LRALEEESKAADKAIVPLMYSINGVRRAGDDWESTLGRVNVETDKLNEGVETATTRLENLFGLLKQQDAVQQFSDDLLDLAGELEGVAEGTAEYDELMRDALQTVETLQSAHDGLSDSFLETLVLEIQTGDLEYAVELMQKVQNYLEQGFAPGFQGLEIPITMGDLPFIGTGTGGMASNLDGLTPQFTGEMSVAAPTAAQFDGMNVTVNMPAGSDGQDVVRALQQYARQSGTIPVPMTDAVRG
jgi:hypothetical protein